MAPSGSDGSGGAACAAADSRTTIEPNWQQGLHFLNIFLIVNKMPSTYSDDGDRYEHTCSRRPSYVCGEFTATAQLKSLIGKRRFRELFDIVRSRTILPTELIECYKCGNQRCGEGRAADRKNIYSAPKAAALLRPEKMS